MAEPQRVYRVESDMQTYVAASLDEAISFIRQECAEGMEEYGTIVTINPDWMTADELAQLPEWES